MKKPWRYDGECCASGGPADKTLGACGPSGFGLETSLGTTFTMIHPRLFQIMSHFIIFLVVIGDQQRRHQQSGSPQAFEDTEDSHSIVLLCVLTQKKRIFSCAHIFLLPLPDSLNGFYSLMLYTILKV